MLANRTPIKRYGIATYSVNNLLDSAVSTFGLFGGRHVVSASPGANVVRREGQSMLMEEEHYEITATYGLVIQEETV
jgi:hypothetical protein